MGLAGTLNRRNPTTAEAPSDRTGLQPYRTIHAALRCMGEAMKFRIEIDCDNAAFHADWRDEVIRIMRDLSEELDYGVDGLGMSRGPILLHDVNGNTVGKAWVE
jgi:hypothetical protein